MSREVWTRDGKFYRVTEEHGKFWVSKPGHGGLGSAKTLQDALALIVSHAGSEIRSID